MQSRIELQAKTEGIKPTPLTSENAESALERLFREEQDFINRSKAIERDGRGGLRREREEESVSDMERRGKETARWREMEIAEWWRRYRQRRRKERD